MPESSLSISGKVVDGLTGEPLASITVFTEPESSIASTGIDGSFRISDQLKSGTAYTVTAMAKGYKVWTRQLVLGRGEVRLDVSLSPVDGEDGPVVCSEDGETRCVVESNREREVCRNGFWENISCENGTVCGAGACVAAVEVEASAQGQGILYFPEASIVCRDCRVQFALGSTVTVDAISSVNGHFVQWAPASTVCGRGVNPNCGFVVSEPTRIVGMFSEQPVLAVRFQNASESTISVAADMFGLDRQKKTETVCVDQNCTAIPYLPNTPVQLTTTAPPWGYDLRWNFPVGCVGREICEIEGPGTVAVEGEITPRPWSIGVAVSGSGRILRNGNSVCSGGSCPTNAYPGGQAVKFQAVAAPGWVFQRWDGPCDQLGDTTCELFLNPSEWTTRLNLVAVFEPATFPYSPLPVDAGCRHLFRFEDQFNADQCTRGQPVMVAQIVGTDWDLVDSRNSSVGSAWWLGGSAYVNTGISSVGGTPFRIDLTVRPDTDSAGTLFSNTSSAASTSVTLNRTPAGGLSLVLNAGFGMNVADSTIGVLPKGQWKQVSLVVGTQFIQVQVDGDVVVTISDPSLAQRLGDDAGPLLIGATHLPATGPTNFFIGAIDEFRIFDPNAL